MDKQQHQVQYITLNTFQAVLPKVVLTVMDLQSNKIIGMDRAELTLPF
jgi:hypothetical protein